MLGQHGSEGNRRLWRDYVYLDPRIEGCEVRDVLIAEIPRYDVHHLVQTLAGTIFRGRFREIVLYLPGKVRRLGVLGQPVQPMTRLAGYCLLPTSPRVSRLGWRGEDETRRDSDGPESAQLHFSGDLRTRSGISPPLCRPTRATSRQARSSRPLGARDIRHSQ